MSIRPININQDLTAIMALLNSVFRENLDPDQKRMMAGQVALSRESTAVLRVRQMLGGRPPGFVYEKDGCLIGNLSVFPAQKTPGRFLVANVAVLSEYRRQGIAQQLMAAAETLVRETGGDTIALQVREQNNAAITLYEKLGYQHTGYLTNWFGYSSRLENTPRSPMPAVRALRRKEWLDAFQLDLTAVKQTLQWPDLLQKTAYQKSVQKSINNLLSARQTKEWVVAAPNQLQGMLALWFEWGAPYHFNMRIHPDAEEVVARALLNTASTYLHHAPPRRVRIDHPARDLMVDPLLQKIGMIPRRTLAVMFKSIV